MDLSQLAGLGGLPIVVGAVQLVKNSFPTAPNYVIVGSALLISEWWSEGTAYALHTVDPVIAMLLGVVLWLMSMGVWSGTKAVAQDVNKP